MESYKKWLHIAIVFILSFSLLSPAAMAETQQYEANELETSSILNNPSNDEVLEKGITKQLSTITTNDSATIFSSEPKGYVTISVEKFTLGQGYAVEPIQVPFYEGEKVGQVVARLLGTGNFNDGNGSEDENITYLSNIKDNDSSALNVPQYIQDKMAEEHEIISGKFDEDWLGEFDYTGQSGWIYIVNNKMPNFGMSEYLATGNDVIRLQFTVWGYGLDLGFGFSDSESPVEPYIKVANKDALTTKIAEINSAPNKSEILENVNIQSAYDTAYAQLTNMESSQTDVDAALTQLNTALNGDTEEVVKVDKTVLQDAIEHAEQNKASVKVSIDGQDIASTDFWVTQDDLDTYTGIILSAQQLIADENAIQEDVDAKVLALNDATTTFDKAKEPGLQATISTVKFTVAPKTTKLKLYDKNDKEVDIGAGVEGTYNVYTATIAAGKYRYEGFNSTNNSVGGGQLTVTTAPNQEFQFRQLNFKASNAGWVVNNDYTVKVGQGKLDDTSLKLGDVTAQGEIPVLALVGNIFAYSFIPDAKHNQHSPYSGNTIKITMATSAYPISATMQFSGNRTFTIPQEAQLFVGKKSKHFVAFEEILPVGEPTINSDGTKTYSFALTNGGEYNYRVSQTGKLTNVGTFKTDPNTIALKITKEQLDIQSQQAILNKGTYLEGNIYLNINEQNHLKLNQGEQFKLLTLRSWQALIEGINNYYFEPDFHFEIVTGEDVIDIEQGKPGSYSTINARKNGTAIVKVTYDALKVNGSSYIADANNAFSAIWPENVGLFVVTVGQGDTGISTGIESNKERNQQANKGKVGNLQNGVFDADIDSVYYAQGEPGAYYTFTPTTGSSVSILRPEINHGLGTASYEDGTFSTEGVQSSDNGSFTALLTEGRNIIKVEKDGKAEYHVMTARPLDISIENLTKPNEKVTPGDKVKVTFKGLSFPANKIAGIYNFNAQLNFIGGPEQQLIAGLKKQYNITTQANDVTFTIPTNHQGTYTLKEGHIKLGFFGSPMGEHRKINPETGASPNLNALEREGYYSIFPEITIIEGSNEVVDTLLLQEEIEKAEQNKATIKVSVDGKDVNITDSWVTQAELDIYTNVIVSAQQLIADENAAQTEIDSKVLALNQATAAFDQAKKAGTKSNANTTTLNAYNTVSKYMLDKLKNPKFDNEWWILTLARGGFEVPADYYDTYYNNVVDYVKSKNGVLDQRKYTEYSRLIIALTAIGTDPTNVGGYNIVEKLADFNKVTWQGVNGAYYGLIALDTWGFELPATATTTREKLINHILEKQLADGGWALSGTSSDPDMTAMAIQSLAPYYKTNSKVKTAVDTALTTLTNIQLPNGGYKSWGIENVESAAQVVTALASLGIDANKDPRFNKVIANIMTYYSPIDGGFKHILSQTKADGMATEQVGYTLAAYHRLLNGQTTLYNTSDAKSNNPSNPDGENGSNPSTPEEGENNNPGNGENNNNPGGSQPFGSTKFLIKISSSEIPLRATSVEFYAGETVFDVLKRVTAENGIDLSYRETQYGTYIEGIDGLYEFDRGPLSGWMYRVNGHFPSYSAALYTLSPGDFVEWLYTLDLGKDIGGYVDGIENDGTPGEDNKEICKEKAIEDCKDTEVPKEAEGKCGNKAEQCTEETNKGNKDGSVAEITVENGSSKAVITSDNIQEYLEKKIPNFVIQSENNFKIEVPTSIFKEIKLAKDEKVTASVTTQPESKQFTVNFGIETVQGEIKPIYLGKNYLKVTLPADDVKSNTIVLQLIGGEYKPVPHKVINNEIVLYTKTSGTFVIVESSVSFNDIAHLANKEEIEFLASRLIIQGTTPKTFEPNKPITRAQFAALISRSLGLQASNTNPFNDTKGKWYESDIQALYEAGITKGTTSSTFNPEAPITRQQAAAFMARILEYLNADVKSNGKINFNDINNISTEYLPYIELLNSLDIMTGKQDGSFDPGASLTRGQTAKILKRTLTIADMM